MRLMIFTGAGASVEAGVPSMRSLVEQFRVHLERRASSHPLVARIDERLGDPAYDIEHLIEEIDAVTAAGPSLAALGQVLAPELLAATAVTRAEAEWFVHHVCERVRLESAAALWGPTLRSIPLDMTVDVVTTNYDRAIELAAEAVGFDFEEPFESFAERDYAVWRGFEGEGHRLIKLHGSTDWYQSAEEGRVIRLSHPVPLFGNMRIELGDGGGTLASALVLPSREKLKNHPPFPELTHRFREAADRADVAIFLGASLRDPDVRDVCNRCAERIPTLVVSRNATHVPDGVAPAKSTVVLQSASHFLVSTLPQLIRDGSFAGGVALEEQRVGILDDCVDLRSAVAGPAPRRQALERLWLLRVGLDEELLRSLLSEGGEIALDALGLVMLSPARDSLVGFVKQLAESDQALRADLALLSSMTRESTEARPEHC